MKVCTGCATEFDTVEEFQQGKYYHQFDYKESIPKLSENVMQKYCGYCIRHSLCHLCFTHSNKEGTLACNFCQKKLFTNVEICICFRLVVCQGDDCVCKNCVYLDKRTTECDNCGETKLLNQFLQNNSWPICWDAGGIELICDECQSSS